MVNKLDPSRLEALLESARLLQSSLELDTISETSAADGDGPVAGAERAARGS